MSIEFEEGAFEGAISEEIGGSELANGSLFLDELARFALDLHARLVRVLKRVNSNDWAAHVSSA
jgi:transcriptional regulator with GAF, ATPase, and Fis domain